jgi:hypothetical protein
MFVIDLLLEEVAKEIKDAPGWLTLIIMWNLLLGWQVVLNAVEGLGFHTGSEKALIATLAAIACFSGKTTLSVPATLPAMPGDWQRALR